MTQDKINKAVSLLENAYNKINLMLEANEGFHTLGSLSMSNISEAKSLLQSDNETLYTRKQLQEACSKAYYRGVDNRPYVERFDEYLNEEDNAKLALYCNDNQWHCHKCDGVVYVGNDRCRRCGQKLIWPDNKKKFVNIDPASPEGDKSVEVTFDKNEDGTVTILDSNIIDNQKKGEA